MKNLEQQKVPAEEKLILQLYVSGMSVKSMEAIENITRLCEVHLIGKFELEIIDIYKHPELLQDQQIVFSPSLVKIFPQPRKILVGTMADSQKVMQALGISA